MVSTLVDKLANKTLTKKELFQMVKQNFDLLPEIIEGVSSEKAAIRYGCGKVLMDLSYEHPEKLYSHMDFFIQLLQSKYRILTWQALGIIANLTQVDTTKKFDTIFDTYFDFLKDDYMVTVANVVGHASKIAHNKPYLIPKITKELLKVEGLKTTPHLTDECKKVIAEKTIQSFDMFFSQIKNKEEVLSFVKNYTGSSKKTLKTTSKEFLHKWNI